MFVRIFNDSEYLKNKRVNCPYKCYLNSAETIYIFFYNNPN